MSDRGKHCPFLNRADARCSANFSLDKLDQAFDVCCGSFAKCSVYGELLAERRARRAAQAANPGCGAEWPASDREASDAPSPFVSLTLSNHHAKQATRA